MCRAILTFYNARMRLRITHLEGMVQPRGTLFEGDGEPDVAKEGDEEDGNDA